jgi:hypothetical protein
VAEAPFLPNPNPLLLPCPLSLKPSLLPMAVGVAAPFLSKDGGPERAMQQRITGGDGALVVDMRQRGHGGQGLMHSNGWP